MSCASATFWRDCERHHDLAEEFERHVRITSPNTFTGRCPCGNSCFCTWLATTVRYYEYTGPEF